MSGIIKTLKTKTDNTEQSVYPKTVLEAVVDTDTNQTLDVILDNLNEKIDNIEPGGGGGGGGTTYELSRADDTITLTGGDGSSSEVNISDKISNKRVDITGQTIDLNSLTLADGTTDIALYINKTNSGSTNISNVPVGSTPFTLDVELIRWASTTDYISKQVFICSSGKHQIRVRYCTSGTWGDWSTYDFNDIVSKSGDTMTGTLNIDSPNFPAIKLNRTGTTTNYTAIQFNNDNGMLGGLGMNTPSGDMVVMDKTGVGYPMLDKRNYNQYALPLSGGTVTGATTFSSLLTTSNGSVVARQANEANWGTAGYNVIAKIVVKRKYMSNSTLMLTLSSFNYRSRAEGKIFIKFANVGTASATTIEELSTCGTPAIYYVLTSNTSADTATLELIATKAAYENFAIINISTSSHFRARADITFPMTFESSLRNGAVAATTYTILDSDNYSTQIPAATQSAVGLMSAADKKKLDGIATGANKITVESSLSNTSTNPVQSKVVHSHMSARLQLTGGTMTGDIKFNNDKGIKDINGNWMLVKSSSVAATLGSIRNKYPTYVGHTSSTSETTYVRGQFLALYGATCINANAAIGVNSDKRVKTNESLLIDEIDKYNQFFDNLQPRKYNYIRDEEGKAKSIGFFAQEVHQALLDAGLTLEDFGGINIQESFLEGQAEGDDEAVWYQDFYSLAYDEFIPIIVSKIQYLEKMYNARLEEIENDYNAKLSSLEEKISKLEEAKA